MLCKNLRTEGKVVAFGSFLLTRKKIEVIEAKLDRIENKISYTGIDSISKDVYNKP